MIYMKIWNNDMLELDAYYLEYLEYLKYIIVWS